MCDGYFFPFSLFPAQCVHHAGNTLFSCFRTFLAFDLPHLLLLMSEGELGPELLGLAVAGDDLLQVTGYSTVRLCSSSSMSGDGVAALALGAGAQLRVHHHHVPFAHIHE